MPSCWQDSIGSLTVLGQGHVDGESARAAAFRPTRGLNARHVLFPVALLKGQLLVIVLEDGAGGLLGAHLQLDDVAFGRCIISRVGPRYGPRS
mmetsp:Transcript_33979/g.41916  ORF Transcript_33979/g.41916 Transcript_33979/m.41916 type:complete len:93 (+) Transcript_33979:540-818(+)